MNTRPDAATELAIRDLVARFADCAIRRDLTGFSALWTEDAVWTIGDPLPSRAEGRDAIVAMLDGLLGNLSFFVQLVHSGVVSITNSDAQGRWLVQEVGRLKSGQPYHNYAFYEDRYRLDDGVWRFVSRVYDYLWLDQETPIRDGLPPPANLSDI